MKLFETLISQPDYEKNILKTIVRLRGQTIYDEMSHTVVYLFSTPNLGNYQADMAILPFQYFQ